VASYHRIDSLYPYAQHKQQTHRYISYRLMNAIGRTRVMVSYDTMVHHQLQHIQWIGESVMLQLRLHNVSLHLVRHHLCIKGGGHLSQMQLLGGVN
jgi:hypothetical protein